MINTTHRLVLLTLVLLASACAARGVPVANPAATGTLVATTATSLSSIERSVGQTQGNPTLLEDTATLVRLDGAEVCFEVAARYAQDRGAQLDAGLASATLTHDGGVLSPPRASLDPPTTIGNLATEAYDTGPDGYSYSTGEILEFELVERRGVLCFTHAGAIAPSNEHLRLAWQSNRFDFSLEAAAPPPAWPPGAITAPGYESVASR